MKHFLLILLLFGGISLTAQNVTYTYDAAGNRTERVISLSAQLLKSSEELSDATPIEDLLAERKIKIYPNPTKGMLAVEVPDFDKNVKGEYTIHNATGRLIKKQKAAAGKTTFDLTAQPSGIYLLRIQLNNEVVTWKIIKE